VEAILIIRNLNPCAKYCDFHHKKSVGYFFMESWKKSSLIYYLHYKEEVFYVGRTIDGKKRLIQHKTRFGKEIKMEIIDQVEDDDKNRVEMFYIHLFKSWGFSLVNKDYGRRGDTSWQINIPTINLIKLYKKEADSCASSIAFNNYKIRQLEKEIKKISAKNKSFNSKLKFNNDIIKRGNTAIKTKERQRNGNMNGFEEYLAKRKMKKPKKQAVIEFDFD